jgi:hypothetical protein
VSKVSEMTAEWVAERCEEDGDCLMWACASSATQQPRYSIKGPAGKTTSVQMRRVVWERERAPIPVGKMVTTTCGSPLCLNHEHMALTTKAAVIKKVWARPDAKVKKFLASIRSRATRGKLDMEKARYIRASNKTLKELAEEFGVSTSLVGGVRQGLRWREAIGNPFAGLGG